MIARPAAAALIATLLLSRPGAAQTPPSSAGGPAGRCGVCHPSERVQFERSAHAREDVHCVACHGGNERSTDVATAHSGNFVGRPARATIPKLCASCHADEERMRAYNLPVDQYALYLTSGHGRRLAAGDTRVAVCSDCHGAHEILPPSDQASSVYPTNVPRTCGRCHGDRSTAAGSRMSENIFEAYRRSVHARALIDESNPRAPTCVSCHGVHGIAPPAIGDIGKVCGQCHAEERRYFAAGPHQAGLDHAGLPECASCHGNHAIVRAPPSRLALVCAKCHPAGTPPRATGLRLWTEYRTALAEIEKAEALAKQADAVPINTEDYRARLAEGRTYLAEALPAAHSVSEDIVTGHTARARSVGREVESEIYTKLGNLRVRRILLIVFWFYILLTILVLRRFRRSGASAS